MVGQGKSLESAKAWPVEGGLREDFRARDLAPAAEVSRIWAGQAGRTLPGRGCCKGERQGQPAPPRPQIQGPSLSPQPQAALVGPGEQAAPSGRPAWETHGKAGEPDSPPSHSLSRGRSKPRVRGGRHAVSCPDACTRGTQTLHATCAKCRPSPPWRNGGGLGSGASPGTTLIQGRDTRAHRGPRAGPACAALAGAE